MDSIVSFGAPILLGLFIGVCSGMLGIGGGTIMVPAFRLLFGMSPLMSTATSLFTIIPTSLSGAISHIRQKTARIPLGLTLGLGGALTSPLGVLLATISPPWLVMVVAAIIIGYSAVNMLLKAIKMKPAKVPLEAEEALLVKKATVAVGGEPAVSASESSKMVTEVEAEKAAETEKPSRKSLITGLAIGLFAGLISGYVGVGGGFIMVPLMLAFLGVSMKEAPGTSLIAMIILAIPGTIQQGLLGNIDYFVGLVAAIGSIPGAIIGSKLVRIIPERTLRFIFGGFLIVAAALLALNEFHVLG